MASRLTKRGGYNWNVLVDGRALRQEIVWLDAAARPPLLCVRNEDSVKVAARPARQVLQGSGSARARLAAGGRGRQRCAEQAHSGSARCQPCQRRPLGSSEVLRGPSEAPQQGLEVEQVCQLRELGQTRLQPLLRHRVHRLAVEGAQELRQAGGSGGAEPEARLMPAPAMADRNNHSARTPPDTHALPTSSPTQHARCAARCRARPGRPPR